MNSGPGEPPDGIYSSAEALESLELKIVNDPAIREIILAKCFKSGCSGTLKSHGKSGNPNAFGAIRISVKCNSCGSSKRLHAVLQMYNDQAVEENEPVDGPRAVVRRAYANIKSICDKAEPTDKQAGKRSAEIQLDLKGPVQKKLAFLAQPKHNDSFIVAQDPIISSSASSTMTFTASSASASSASASTALATSALATSAPAAFVLPTFDPAISAKANSAAAASVPTTSDPAAYASVSATTAPITLASANVANNEELEFFPTENENQAFDSDFLDLVPSPEIQMEKLILENEQLKADIAKLETTVARLNVRIQQQASQLAASRNSQAALTSNTNRNVNRGRMPSQVRISAPHTATSNSNAISYAAVAKKGGPTPPKPGNEDRNQARRSALKPVSQLTEKEKQRVLAMAIPAEKRQPQSFHRLHIKIRLPRGVRNERIQIQRRRMFQFLRLTKLEKHVTLATTIGKDLYELYVCSDALDNLEQAALRSNVTLITEFDPCDFSHIYDDDNRLKARNAAATRLAHLLVRAKFINLRAAILSGFDQSITRRAMEASAALSNAKVEDWKLKYYSHADSKHNESLNTQSLRDRIFSRDNADSIAADTSANASASNEIIMPNISPQRSHIIAIPGPGSNNESRSSPRLDAEMTDSTECQVTLLKLARSSLGPADFKKYEKIWESGIDYADLLKKRNASSEKGKDPLDRFLRVLPAIGDRPDRSIHEITWPAALLSGQKLSFDERVQLIADAVLCSDEIEILNNAFHDDRYLEPTIKSRGNELLPGSLPEDRFIGFLPNSTSSDAKLIMDQRIAFIKAAHPEASKFLDLYLNDV